MAGEAKDRRRQPAACFVILIGVIVLAGHDRLLVQQSRCDRDVRGRACRCKFGVAPALALRASDGAHPAKIGRRAGFCKQ